jgi:hypothetical protein
LKVNILEVDILEVDILTWDRSPRAEWRQWMNKTGEKYYMAENVEE